MAKTFTRERPKTKAELHEMLTEAVRKFALGRLIEGVQSSNDESLSRNIQTRSVLEIFFLAIERSL
jgi:hypothetical protein